MSRRMLFLALALPLALLATTPAVAGDRGMSAKSMRAQVYQVDLDALNGSGVDGKAILILRDGVLKVKLHARGLEPGMLHPQHIHGVSGSDNATCPPPTAGGDILTLEEGADFYGPVIQPLTPFPMAPKGKVNYHQTFDVQGDLLDLSDETIVLHGAFVNGMYVATLPVACGEIN